MKPTDRQIEAARLSEENLHSIGHARYLVERASPENPEVCFDYELVADLLSIIDRLTAAAEVGETVEVGNVSDSYKMAMRREIAATIERCAQVAEGFRNYGTWGQLIAAEIRALKDKP